MESDLDYVTLNTIITGGIVRYIRDVEETFDDDYRLDILFTMFLSIVVFFISAMTMLLIPIAAFIIVKVMPEDFEYYDSAVGILSEIAYVIGIAIAFYAISAFAPSISLI